MLLIIDNYDSFTYNLYQLCAQLINDVTVVRNDQLSVQQIADLKPSKIIISPGPKAPQQAGICLELIRELSPKLPIFGVCLGMQAIGEAFGGHVIRAPEPIHGKSSLIYHNSQQLYKDLPSPFLAGRYHSLIVEEKTLPSCLVVEAKTDSGLIMGLRHCSFPCHGVQFHPESILTPQGQRIIKNFVLDM